MAVALVVAAGQGERLGSGGPKAFVQLNGKAMFEWSIAALCSIPRIEQIVLALPPGETAPAGCIGVTGGLTRNESVQAAFAAARSDLEPVLIHDAARPLVTAALIEQVLAGLDGVDCAIAASPVTDTTKECDDEHLVLRTLDRSRLWSVQTPQVFTRAALQRALAHSPPAEVARATDEATLVERSGGMVRVVPAPAENLKVTTPLDLSLAELLLSRRVD
ncbi:MAG TPA: 2-C-methyl-D-erythritol 4-phosphate cytidylyltransferase [Solirubrobacteraceae bacterium]|jgi:2-C-methyl-D-erythritol 4-phosphate cytidylyltransferase|nr:2-C-methyl-D-erythritol 4-phosphate cytidylyltransferase [Solirubrobacteraceae bacterium]